MSPLLMGRNNIRAPKYILIFNVALDGWKTRPFQPSGQLRLRDTRQNTKKYNQIKQALGRGVSGKNGHTSHTAVARFLSQLTIEATIIKRDETLMVRK